MDTQYVLNAYMLAAIGSILGTLAGAVGFMIRALLHSKAETIETLREERDFFRDLAFRRDR